LPAQFLRQRDVQLQPVVAARRAVLDQSRTVRLLPNLRRDLAGGPGRATDTPADTRRSPFGSRLRYPLWLLAELAAGVRLWASRLRRYGAAARSTPGAR